MVITWNDADDSPEVLSVKRGSTVAELADMLPNARARGDFRRSNTLTETTTRDSAPDRETADDVQAREMRTTLKIGADHEGGLVRPGNTLATRNGGSLAHRDHNTS